MPHYPIYCYSKGCKNLAVYKIAARWSDGSHGELKTYGLTCADCLRAWFFKSVEKNKQCRRYPGEKLETPGIYSMDRGQRDQRLPRLPELEQKLLDEEKNP